jgi:hypothetical protein
MKPSIPTAGVAHRMTAQQVLVPVQHTSELKDQKTTAMHIFDVWADIYSNHAYDINGTFSPPCNRTISDGSHRQKKIRSNLIKWNRPVYWILTTRVSTKIAGLNLLYLLYFGCGILGIIINIVYPSQLLKRFHARVGSVD